MNVNTSNFEDYMECSSKYAATKDTKISINDTWSWSSDGKTKLWYEISLRASKTLFWFRDWDLKKLNVILVRITIQSAHE